MTRDRSVDERISTWLFEEAPDQLPDRVLRATFERTRTSRQRRGRPGWRLGTMLPRTPVLIAAGAAAIVVALAASAFVLRTDNHVANPGPSPTPTSAPSPSPSASASATSSALASVSVGGELAVARKADGNVDLWLVAADGSDIRRLTTDPAEDLLGAWSPDGSTLYFVRRTSLDPEVSDIYAFDLASGTERRITTGPGVEADPRISPSGGELAFDQWPDAPGVHVMDATGTGDRLVRPATSDQDVLMGWASDDALWQKHGDHDLQRIDIASGTTTTAIHTDDDLGDFILSPDGTTFATHSADNLGIVLMDLDGTNVRPVIKVPGKGTTIAWAPDGRHLVYQLADGWLRVVGTDGTPFGKWIQGSGALPRPTP